MAKSKHKRRGQRKQKISKKQLRKKRQKAAKIKDKVQRHRKENKQNKSSKGFFAIIGSYLENKLRDIEKNFQGSAFSKKANSIYFDGRLDKSNSKSDDFRNIKSVSRKQIPRGNKTSESNRTE